MWKKVDAHLLWLAVEALREIADQLGKKDWDFKLNPCDGNSNWSTPKRKDMPWYTNMLECNCTFLDNLCHVENMWVSNITPSFSPMDVFC